MTSSCTLIGRLWSLTHARSGLEQGTRRPGLTRCASRSFDEPMEPGDDETGLG